MRQRLQKRASWLSLWRFKADPNLARAHNVAPMPALGESVALGPMRKRVERQRRSGLLGSVRAGGLLRQMILTRSAGRSAKMGPKPKSGIAQKYDRLRSIGLNSVGIGPKLADSAVDICPDSVKIGPKLLDSGSNFGDVETCPRSGRIWAHFGRDSISGQI